MAFRILHTADWHLGKSFFHVDLLQDQKHFLNQIKARLSSQKYDALVVCGDIFDKEQPSPRDYKLLEDFIIDTHNDNPDLPLFFIMGNHDSSIMGFTRNLITDKNVFITVNTEKLLSPAILTNSKNEKLAVYSLPFLREFPQNENLTGQTQMVKEACKQILQFHKQNYSDLPSVLCAHLSTIGSVNSSSEIENGIDNIAEQSEYDKKSVANVEAVSPSVFDGFTYTALGHIHKCNPCNSKKNVWYSGSPILYYFDANPQTFMLDVVIQKDSEPVVEKIEFSPLHKTLRITDYIYDYLMENATQDLIQKYENCYLEFIHKDFDLPVNARASIKKNFNVLHFEREKSVRQIQSEAKINARTQIIKKSNVQPEELFDAFFNENFSLGTTDDKLHSLARKEFATLWQDCLRNAE